MAFVASKIIWVLAQPGNVLLGLLIVGLLFQLVRWRRTGLWLVGLATFGFAAVAVLPVASWVMAPLENRFPAPAKMPERVDGIVVLGGSLRLPVIEARGQVALTEAAERLTGFVALARRYPNARLVFTGGIASLFPGQLTESAAAAQFFADLGLDPGRVEFEHRSRTTFENALYAHDLVKPKADETWLLVTSAFHMPRSIGVFDTVGWTVTPYPVDYRTSGSIGIEFGFSLATGLSATGLAAHEWLGLIGYRMMGRTRRLFPGPADR